MSRGSRSTSRSSVSTMGIPLQQAPHLSHSKTGMTVSSVARTKAASKRFRHDVRRCYSRRVNCERPPQVLDTVVWERDGGIYTGLIWDIRGRLADILTGHGGALVYIEDLKVLVRSEDWKEGALVNHLWAVYGIRVDSSGTGSVSAAKNQLDEFATE